MGSGPPPAPALYDSLTSLERPAGADVPLAATKTADRGGPRGIFELPNVRLDSQNFAPKYSSPSVALFSGSLEHGYEVGAVDE